MNYVDKAMELADFYQTAVTGDYLSNARARAYLLKHLEAMEADRVRLLEALKIMTSHYCNLVRSGDAGNWEPDSETEVGIARAAIAQSEAQS